MKKLMEKIYVITLEHIDIDNIKQIIFCNFDQKIESPLFHLFQKVNTFCNFDQKIKSQTDGRTDTDGKLVRQTETTDGLTDRQTDRQTGRTDGQRDKPLDG
jgi:hypothetical protein